MQPRAHVREVRGNVDTRIRKLQAGEVDALVLAGAGLARLGLTPEPAHPLPVEDMVPAPGQGALAVQARRGSEAWDRVAALDHGPSRTAFEAERHLVRLLGGGCRLPLGAYAELRGEAVRLLAVVVRPDGSDLLWAQVEGAGAKEAATGAAETLRAGGADAILAEVRG
jgi:hydroxymethylbilane synthase